nr:putative protein [uncultured bacterium]AMJ35493.1 putative protein [uncultured bacterium]AMJ35816.1 putative protein [uncultured bacterium]
MSSPIVGGVPVQRERRKVKTVEIAGE